MQYFCTFYLLIRGFKIKMLTNKKVTEYGKFTSNLLKGEVSKNGIPAYKFKGCNILFKLKEGYSSWWQRANNLLFQ